MSKEILEINLKNLIEQETGQQFKNNKIKCPFHNDKTASLSITKNRNGKEVWSCFGACNIMHEDAITFIKKYKGVSYIQALKYLGLEIDPGEEENQTILEKVINKAKNDYKNYNFKSIHPFTDGKTVKYFKVKFLMPNGDKDIRYYHLDNGIPKQGRGTEIEYPYNITGMNRALESRVGKSKINLFIVEGESDADTLIKLGFTATSLKNVKNDFKFDFLRGCDVYFVGDTGVAGERYKKYVWDLINENALTFKVIDLKGIEKLGDNKDITDWLEAGHTINEFYNCMKDSWNWCKSTKWKYTLDIKGGVKPQKVWENLELLLQREGIEVKLNMIDKGIEYTTLNFEDPNNLITSLQSLQNRRGLHMSREDLTNSLEIIAENNKYNGFVDLIADNNENPYTKKDIDLIKSVFSCLEVNYSTDKQEDIKEIGEFYFNLFLKWCLNLVKMSENTLDKQLSNQGVLVLQGNQGVRKSTFFKCLMPNKKWFKGESSLDPTDKDSVMQNTKYILTELGELEDTFKREQAKLKQFFTSSYDEYRRPYTRLPIKNARITSFCGTVNKKDFLKDETGNRRYWIIPIHKCNIEKLLTIDIVEFWRAVYRVSKCEDIKSYLTTEEIEYLNKNNIEYAVMSNVKITLDEKIAWKDPQDNWTIYSKSDLCDKLDIKDKVTLSREMERRGFPYKSHRVNNIVKTGYKMPKIIIAAPNIH